MRKGQRDKSRHGKDKKLGSNRRTFQSERCINPTIINPARINALTKY